MVLAELFDDPALPAVEVGALALDHRLVGPGTVFFAVRGFTRDGHEFAAQAAAQGAAALVVDHRLDDLPDVPQVVVPDVRRAMAPAAARLHGDPTAQLQVAGITGTNGKTTTSYLLRALLEGGGRRTGLLGTVSSIVGGVESPTVRTTPEAIDLQRTFAAMRDAGDRACVMEVSSHALELGRADAIHWAVAAFTNLSQDHLDFHPDMEAYFQAKRKLLVAAAAQGAPLVVDVDDAHGRRLAEEFPQATTVALEADADLRPDALHPVPGGTDVVLPGRGEVRVPLPGRFNVRNALAACAAAEALGVDWPAIAAALPHARTAPGRFEPVDEGQGFTVLVDYAHTPEAVDNVLAAARELTTGRLLVVLGAGGNRDAGKRPRMGEAAARHADHVIVTSDNPRDEDPEAIIAAVRAGAPEAESMPDRRAAIHRAVALARGGDVVVVAGKGHEQGQELAGGVKVPFDDATVCREALRARLDG
jgi:UDP-N-acetylmuramoyl-L-alanyl-D-glutamate--2,6-diaminopimelate ligase